MTNEKDMLFPPVPPHPFSVIELRKKYRGGIPAQEGISISEDICRIMYDPISRKFIGQVFVYNGESLEFEEEADSILELMGTSLPEYCPLIKGEEWIEEADQNGEWDFMTEHNPYEMLQNGIDQLLDKTYGIWKPDREYFRDMGKRLFDFYNSVLMARLEQ